MKKKIFLLFILASLTAISNDNLDLMNEIMPSKNAKIVSGYKTAKEGVQTVFVYDEDAMYTVYARVSYLTTIMLQPGETVTFVGGGDTSRWRRATGTTGSSDGMREVIYIKPLYTGLKTNLVINTNKRSYQINLISDKTLYNPLIKWDYPQDELLVMEIQKKFVQERENSQETIMDPTSLDYGYTISTNKYNFAPQQVFNDSKKTYIQLKEDIQETPSLYIKDGNKLLLVNYRTKGSFLVVDRLFSEAELRIDNKKVITFCNLLFICVITRFWCLFTHFIALHFYLS